VVIGGQTNFIVNQTRIRNTIIWKMNVAVMLTLLPQSRWRGPSDRLSIQADGKTQFSA
jgi:hypothetical protein